MTNVVFVTTRKPSVIYSLVVMLDNLFGEWFNLLLVNKHQLI
jgi:hypothetical protein